MWKGNQQGQEARLSPAQPVASRSRVPLVLYYTVGCGRNRMANLSKASNVVQEKRILYGDAGLAPKWHAIPVAANCTELHTSRRSYTDAQAKESWSRTSFIIY